MTEVIVEGGARHGVSGGDDDRSATAGGSGLVKGHGRARGARLGAWGKEPTDGLRQGERRLGATRSDTAGSVGPTRRHTATRFWIPVHAYARDRSRGLSRRRLLFT